MLLDNQNVSLAFLCRPYVAGHFASQGKLLRKMSGKTIKTRWRRRHSMPKSQVLIAFFRQKNPEADMINRIISD